MERESKILDRLYNEYSGKVYSLSRFKGLSDEDSQDIVQETFAAVFAGYHSFQNKSSYKTYIVSIARNKIADFYRKRYKRDESELLSSEASPDSTESVIEKTDVKRQIDNLSDSQKELLHLVFTMGLNYEEAAGVLNIPEGTVKSRMFAIKKELKKGLGDNYR